MTVSPFHAAAFLLALSSGLPGVALAQGAARAFPGGASSISETHGDWTLICGVQDDTRICVATQSLAQERTGQRVLTIELEPAADGGVDGSMRLPFGLRLANGVRTQIDAVTVGAPVPFIACYEDGCMADFSLDAAGLDLLRRGDTLRLLATVEDSGESVVLSVSLAGIATALSRSAELLAD